MNAPKLLVFGNPLLDVTVQISNDEILRKYSLDRNGQAEVSLEKLNNIFNDARARYATITKTFFLTYRSSTFTHLSERGFCIQLGCKQGENTSEKGKVE
jgi:hypothetical protein